MKKLKTSEKLIIAVVMISLMVVMWLFHNASASRKYAGINCPKCNSSQVVVTYTDATDVEHTLCLDCQLKFTMTDAESIRDSIDAEADYEPDEEELMLDSLYKPELVCPD